MTAVVATADRKIGPTALGMASGVGSKRSGRPSAPAKGST